MDGGWDEVRQKSGYQKSNFMVEVFKDGVLKKESEWVV